MSKIRKAVILAAGLGSRLKPLTNDVPKCLTEVNGKPILQQLIENLEKNGIEETVIVIGYLGQIVVNKFGNKFRNMKLTYIWNEIYDETNSMYSAWLAREHLKEGTILIEGDTVSEEFVIQQAIHADDGKTYWVVDKFGPQYDGSMSTTDKTGKIIDIRIVRGKLSEYPKNCFKSTGILKLSAEYGKLFSEWLDNDVKEGNVQIYYDLVIAKHLKDAPIFTLDITGREWIEIDSLDDLRRTEKIFMPTKYVIIILGGAGDLPIKKLDNQTPLEFAKIPNINSIASKGETGLIRTMYPGLPMESVVSNLGILGYNPLRYYPNGRASFEALANDIYLEEDEIAFRGNIISLKDWRLKGFSAAQVSDADAKRVFEMLEFDEKEFKIYPVKRNLNLVIFKGLRCNASELRCAEPYNNVGKAKDNFKVSSRVKAGKHVAERINFFIDDIIRQLKQINSKLGTSYDILFLWSPSSEPKLPSFHRKFGIDAAIVSDLDFMRGIGIAARMEAKKVPTATLDRDIDMDARFRYAFNSLRHNDLVFIHLNAPDEKSHLLDVNGKVDRLERIDRKLIGPLIKALDDNYQNKYRIAILPDHFTLLRNANHSDHLVPYLIYGKNIRRDEVTAFNEKAVSEKSRSIIKSYEFMDFFVES